ncbi:MAG: enoyl-CoA hydratase [Micavibrio sp.]|nr:MAG: enoyl-CoA hydratase [Micavibrio sp.]
MKQVLTEKKDGVLTIRINRPEKKNALTPEIYAEMAAAITAADQDTSLHAVVLTGTADNFTAGNDLQNFLDAPPDVENSPVRDFLTAISEAKLPVIAAVEGHAVGVGATMLLHCDFVYAADDAVFQMPFINLGLVPEAGSSLLLPRVAGHQRASEILLLGEAFSAQEAKEMGIINGICTSGTALDTALETAGKLAQKPRKALVESKALLRREFEPLAKRITREGHVFRECLESEESQKAIHAFFDRKKSGGARPK